MGTRSVEDSYEHVQGTPEEYQVNNARVYLFDTATKMFVKSVELTNLTRSGSDETVISSMRQNTYWFHKEHTISLS